MAINWYPGHMAKTRRLMLDDLKNVDCVCELVDARIPLASRNPDLDNIAQSKRRMIVINRADQADPSVTAKWAAFYRAQGYVTIETDSQKGGFLPKFTDAVKRCCADLIERNQAKGQNGRKIRLMIVGIPNVGKSSFINRLLGKKSAIASDRPGVTRIKQWFSLPEGFDFMDTPGMLWPKIETDELGYLLAFTGTIKDEIMDLEDVSCQLITKLASCAPDAVVKRYNITVEQDDGPYDILEKMARARGFLQGRGQVDTERMAKIFLDEFRSGKLGRITLESPQDYGL